MEQGLGRDAADVEAGAAEGIILLHEGHLEAELAGFDGGHIATGAGADYDEIVSIAVGMEERFRRPDRPGGLRYIGAP
jgi:hypothetical protein